MALKSFSAKPTRRLFESLKYVTRKYLRFKESRSLTEQALIDLHFKSERLRSVLEAVPAGILALNRELTIESWNEAAALIFGYSEDEILQNSLLKIISSEHYAMFSSEESLERLSQHTSDTERRFEFTGIHKDGHTIPIEIGFSAYTFQGTQQYTCFIRDITRRKRISEDLQAAKRLADDASRAKSRFLAQVSHEIRTPLGAILGFSDLLINDPTSSQEKRDHYADAIKRNGQLLSRIINDILDLSKVEAGCLTIEKEVVHLEEVFQDLSGFLDLQARDKGIALELELAADAPLYIYTDPIRLRQILLNLVGNAIKFTQRGKVVVQVEPERRAGVSKLVISVTDTGCGIEPEFIDYLFEPFPQFESAVGGLHHASTGLGLALSRKVAIILGGGIELVESHIGRGTTFKIEIDPHLEEVKKQSKQTRRIEHVEPLLPPRDGDCKLAGRSILLTEDSPDNQLLITTFLKRAGADVDIANHGGECLDKVNESKYDLILMDLQMPVMDGYETLRELQRRGVTLPVIAITAHALKEERKRCLAAGFSAHLSKPVDRCQLVNTLENFTRDLVH